MPTNALPHQGGESRGIPPWNPVSEGAPLRRGETPLTPQNGVKALPRQGSIAPNRLLKNPFDHRPVRPIWTAQPFLTRKGVGFVSGGHPQTPARGGASKKRRGPSGLPFFTTLLGNRNQGGRCEEHSGGDPPLSFLGSRERRSTSHATVFLPQWESR